MPIYAYKCESCGFAKDVLQKMSDPLLDICPSCSQPTFKKQLTAAGFQLKGSGWYATDFKGSGSAPATAAKADATPVVGGEAPASNADTAPTAPATVSTTATPTPPKPATPAAPAATGG